MRTPPAAKFRAARAALDLDQDGLARAAGIHLNTVKNVENDNIVSSDTIAAIQKAFENFGIEFLEISGRVGIMLPVDFREPQAAQVKAARVGLLLSRESLSELAGIGPRTLAKIENADPTVQVGKVRACFNALEGLETLFFEIEGRSVVMLPPREYLEAIELSFAAPEAGNIDTEE